MSEILGQNFFNDQIKMIITAKSLTFFFLGKLFPLISIFLSYWINIASLHFYLICVLQKAVSPQPVSQPRVPQAQQRPSPQGNNLFTISKN